MGSFGQCFREGYLWREHRSVISFIITRLIFLNFICPRDQFYNRYINSKISTTYLHDNGTGVKPRKFSSKSSTGKIC